MNKWDLPRNSGVYPAIARSTPAIAGIYNKNKLSYTYLICTNLMNPALPRPAVLRGCRAGVGQA